MEKKTVLITGCSSGFGKLTVKRFADQGWNVIATMRSPENERALVATDDLMITSLDVTNNDSIQSAIERGIARFGALDVLVNNAGRGCFGLFEQVPDEIARAVYDINVLGLMRVTRAVLPLMRQQKQGCIINLTSLVAMLGTPAASVYSSAKFAVLGLTEALALECKPFHIKVRSVAPGSHHTPFGANAFNVLGEGDEETRNHAIKLAHQIEQGSQKIFPPGLETADPKSVADKIFECATAETPIHNPVGADVEKIADLKNTMSHPDFLDHITQVLFP